MLGIPGCLSLLCLLAVTKIIKNARTSMMSQWGVEWEVHQNFRGKITKEVGE